MSGSAPAWLESRAAEVPASLQRRMLAAVADLQPATGPLPLQLAAAARLCLRDAAACGDDRTAAIHLLAADALITDACELAAGDAALLDRIAAACRAVPVPGGAGADEQRSRAEDVR